VVGEEPFAVILADDLIDADPPVLSQMGEVAARLQCSVLGVQEVPEDQTRQYGIVDPKPLEKGIDVVQGIVEKPDPSVAPSRIGVVGRYILTPRIFDLLEQVKPGAGGEIQLTDAIAALLKEERVVAHRFKGTRYDCGSKLGYLAATVAYGRRHAEVGKAFEALLANEKFGR
jgi:UTP--glucose-1-phosphate uridylyltransferase